VKEALKYEWLVRLTRAYPMKVVAPGLKIKIGFN